MLFLIPKKVFWLSISLFLPLVIRDFDDFFVVVDPNSEIAFRVLENFDWINCFCFEIIAFFVCFFSLLYATFCACVAITRSYRVSLIKQV